MDREPTIAAVERGDLATLYNSDQVSADTEVVNVKVLTIP